MRKDRLVPSLVTLGAIFLGIYLFFFVLLPLFVKIVAGLLFYGAITLFVIAGIVIFIKMIAD